jgi:hypothetical protein
MEQLALTVKRAADGLAGWPECEDFVAQLHEIAGRYATMDWPTQKALRDDRDRVTLMREELFRRMQEGPGCRDAKASIRKRCSEILDRKADPLIAANSIYSAAWNAGAWNNDSPCQELQEPGVEFLQLADALEEYQNDDELRPEFEALITKAADSYLSGRPFPDWPEWRDGRWHF